MVETKIKEIKQNYGLICTSLERDRCPIDLQNRTYQEHAAHDLRIPVDVNKFKSPNETTVFIEFTAPINPKKFRFLIRRTQKLRKKYGAEQKAPRIKTFG